MLIRCAVCGRENDPASKFCVDCGKPVSPAGAGPGALGGTVPGIAHGDLKARFGVPPTRISASQPGAIPAPPVPKYAAIPSGRTPCPTCGSAVDAALPFCPKCGARVVKSPTPTTPAAAICSACRRPVAAGVDVFCGHCGTRVALTAADPTPPMGTAVQAPTPVALPTLALLDGAGAVQRVMALPSADISIGRLEGDLRFPDDTYMSPVHASLSVRDGKLFVRDLGSRNGTWIFADEPYKLSDGDTVLVGSQILRFRRLGYPGPHPPEADATRRLGSSTPSADIAVMHQLRADGSARDSCHLSPSRNVVIGRTEGDWLFGYDQTMSGRHAEIRNEDLDFLVIDLGSRNGIAVAVRGERPVRAGQRILIGDQTLRVESL